MGLLDKLFKKSKTSDHEQWVKDHPEKNRPPSAPAENLEEHARMRAKMEQEMSDANAKRNS